MKKIILKTILIGIISLMIFPLCTTAKNISTIKLSETNKKVTVSGKTETGVLAVAILVYSNDKLVDMESCNVNDTLYSCVLNNNLSKGEYTIKVADYNGGNYKSDKITVSNSTSISSNPKTFDKVVIYSLIAGISILCGGGILVLKKRLNN